MHQVGTHGGVQRIVAPLLVEQQEKLMVQLILLAGDLAIARLIVRSDGNPFLLLIDKEIQIRLVLGLQPREKLVR